MSFMKKLMAPLITMVVFALAAAPAYSAQKPAAKTVNIGDHGVLHKGMKTIEAPVAPMPAELKKKETAEKQDTAKLLYTGKVVVDSDPAMLKPKENVAGFAGKDYIIAQTPPTVEFAVVPVEPLWLGESPVKSKTRVSNNPGPWSNWCQANFDSRTGKFYSAIGDHGKYDAHILLVEYDPAKKLVRCLPEVNKVLGRTKNQFAEGKIHGWLDFYQSKDLKSPHLWYCTYWAKYDEPDEEDYATGYDGGHIMSYDVLTGDIVDYGVPLKRASWPYHRVDTQRGFLYAVGMFGEFVAWDINRQQTMWAGYLPAGMGWWERAIMLDEQTGMVYTTNRDNRYNNRGNSDMVKNLIKYDPFKNRFFKLECTVPPETEESKFIEGAKIGSYSHLRAQTRKRGPDGLFWCVTYHGQLFTFDPVKEVTESKGYVWPGEQRYTASMDRSPGGRYLYYLPGAHGGGYRDGSPVIQYDTRTGQKKVLAFLFPYYYDKYGYIPGGTFSVKLDDKGERLFILWNGAFSEYNPKRNAETFGQCSVMVVNIPAGERQE